MSTWKRRMNGTVMSIVEFIVGILLLINPVRGTSAVLWVFTGISLIAEAIIDVLAAVLGNKDEKTINKADP